MDIWSAQIAAVGPDPSGVIPILSGKGTDENTGTYAGQRLSNSKSKIQNQKSKIGISP
jgi:hypothetical protein